MGDRFKDVTINDYEYRVGKFNARDGSFIVVKVAGIIAPMIAPLLKSADAKQLAAAKSPSDVDLTNLDIGAMFGSLASLPEEDFAYLQEKCLRVSRMKIVDGYKDVLNDNGSFAFEHLEDDTFAVMALMTHALVHNLGGFIQGSGLAGLVKGLLATSLSN